MFTKSQTPNLIAIVLVSVVVAAALAALGWMAMVRAQAQAVENNGASLAATPARIIVPNPRVRFAPLAGRRPPAQLAGRRPPAPLSIEEAPLAGRRPPAPLATGQSLPAQGTSTVDFLLLLALAALLFAPVRKQVADAQ